MKNIKIESTEKKPEQLLHRLDDNAVNQLYAFALSLTKESNDAEDLYQETMFLALRNSDKFKDGTNFMAWMKTIMRNAFINGYRKKKRFQNYINTKNSQPNTFDKEQINNEAQSNIMMDELNGLIDRIDDRFKTPFRLFYEGFSYDEIAAKLEVPLGTVKSRIFIARRQLKEAILGLYGGGNNLQFS